MGVPALDELVVADAVELREWLFVHHTSSPGVWLALTRKVGTGRVAWRADDSLPVVQCVRVRRDGPLTGGAVELLSVSAPIDAEGSCAP